jgi:hypothetical protein
MFFSWNDKQSWEPLAAQFQNLRVSQNRLCEFFSSNYEGIVVYHGCRPIDINRYYETGLLRSNSKELDETARFIFLRGDFPEISAQKLNSVIDASHPQDEGRIYTSLDRENLLNHSSHYMIYGSERLIAIAASLSKYSGIDYRQVLKQHGSPTLFAIAVKWEYFLETQLIEFTNRIIKLMSKIRNGKKLPLEDFSFRFLRDLPGSAIISHEHPTQLKDLLKE